MTYPFKKETNIIQTQKVIFIVSINWQTQTGTCMAFVKVKSIISNMTLSGHYNYNIEASLFLSFDIQAMAIYFNLLYHP